MVPAFLYYNILDKSFRIFVCIKSEKSRVSPQGGATSNLCIYDYLMRYLAIYAVIVS